MQVLACAIYHPEQELIQEKAISKFPLYNINLTLVIVHLRFKKNIFSKNV